MNKTTITPEISKYFSSIGKKGGEKNKEKGSQYFRDIAAKRKTHGRQKVKEVSK